MPQDKKAWVAFLTLNKGLWHPLHENVVVPFHHSWTEKGKALARCTAILIFKSDDVFSRITTPPFYIRRRKSVLHSRVKSDTYLTKVFVC